MLLASSRQLYYPYRYRKLQQKVIHMEFLRHKVFSCLYLYYIIKPLLNLDRLQLFGPLSVMTECCEAGWTNVSNEDPHLKKF